MPTSQAGAHELALFANGCEICRILTKSSRKFRVGARPRVLFVSADRVQRAATARALVNAQYDVAVFDTANAMVSEVSGRGSTLAIVEEVDVSMLHKLASANRQVYVVARTDVDPSEVWQLFADAGIRRFSVVPKNVSDLALVDAVARLFGEEDSI